VALQQGPQLASVFGETGAAGAVKTLGTAFLNLVSPVSLVTIGLTGLTAAAIQYFTSTKSDSEKATEALKNHSALIGRIKEAWPEAAAGLREYSAESKTILTQNIKDSVELYKKAVVDASNAAARNLSGVTRRSRASGDPVVEQLAQASKDLMAGVNAGNPSLKEFVERLVDIENQKGTPANLKEIIKQTRDAAGVPWRPSIKISCAPDQDDVDRVWTQVRLAATGDVIFDSDSTRYGSPYSWVINANFKGSTDYEARGRFIPSGTRLTDWSEWLPVTTPNVVVTDLLVDLQHVKNDIPDRFKGLQQELLDVSPLVEQLMINTQLSDAVLDSAHRSLVATVGQSNATFT
jgi:hypothetical protein